MIESSVINIVASDMNQCFRETAGNFSLTRDIFSARVQSYILETKKYLEAAIIGEIGNNTFDHNFGFISELPKGVYCNLSYLQSFTVLADYGMGVKQSLLSVLPSIESDMEALETAFTKRISGRSPEQRGDGLKYVSETIEKNNWHLYFQSGNGSCLIDKNGVIFQEETVSVIGCLAIIDFCIEG